MNEGCPLVSVVIPAYNGEPLIGETLRALGRQTLADFEAIVVDDCSTDATRALVQAWEDPRVRLVSMAVNGGPVLARNRGVEEARGVYIAALDHDDLCRPERLARQVAYLDAHPQALLVGTAAEALVGNRVRPMAYPARTTPMLLAWLLWIENPLVWSSVMIRGSAARSLEPFSRATLIYAEDFDLYHRIAARGEIARIDEPLMLYRQHAGGISKRFVDQMEESARKVLVDRHAALFGADVEDAATLIVRHVMGKRPVPDAAALARLGKIIAVLHAAFLSERDPAASDRALIAAETAKRWAALVNAALRSGAIGIGAALGARAGMTIGGLLKPALIGGARRARQTLAEKIIRSGPSNANT